MKELVRAHTDREDILGKFATEDDFDLLIDEDCDLYNLNPMDESQKNEENVIFKFRKGVFTQEEQDSYNYFKIYDLLAEDILFTKNITNFHLTPKTVDYKR